MAALFEFDGIPDKMGVVWRLGDASEANLLLAAHHYLGALKSGGRVVVIGSRDGEPVAAMIWRPPTSRHLPTDGTWLELSRWCLTPAAGDNAGSRMHKYAVKLIRQHLPQATTLVSYSDPAHGHTGALYRACNWLWAPTWLRLRTPPTGNGDWGTGQQAPKDRWIFPISHDPRREEVLRVNDPGAIRHWRATATDAEHRWARRSPSPDLSAAAQVA